ncbi:hypothetical protein Pint_25196 [Pistacia integerrima]|uniref:Uncharacterized protein n=1 Tax=Pistacia integerrima TaxID=434235 RepID=A0ACC0YG70_9ROSI|nr:hypothetical protein Pint_25196 [Pistacia integerrima]
MENGLLLSLPQHQQLQPISLFVFFPQAQLHFPQPKPAPTHFHFITSHPHLRFPLITSTTRSRRWDSNAENFPAQNFNQQDDDEEDDDEEEEEEDESFYRKNLKRKRRWWSKKPKVKKKRSWNSLDEAIESVWILKVFKSYGWFSPAILISFLLATGPKAFLMSLAIPLVLSVLYLAFDKLWGMTQHKPKHKARMRRKASTTYVSSVEMETEGQQGEGTRKVKKGNQSWVGNNNGSVNKVRQDDPSFGGWDYLDEARFRRRATPETSKSQRTQEGKLSGSRTSDTPLLLRLLIAIFPLIGFWTKMFW